ncbi:hypothetical protein KAR48_17455 [bacterium]|nr:hypothetical protein [bacterium]
MIQVLIGLSLAAAYTTFRNFSRRFSPPFTPIHWSLFFILLGYFFFVIEVIVAFLQEGALRGVLVMGMLSGLGGVIMAVLFYRFIISPRLNINTTTEETAS